MDPEAILEQESLSRLQEEADARRFLYRDVEELIENGFLTQEVDFDGTQVIFRTLSPGEVRRCNIRGSKRGRDLPFLRWCIASSVWMVDGFEVSLDPKDNGPWHIFQDWVKELPNSHIEAFISFFISLRNRVSRALKMVEAYCYEPYSRAMWRLLGKPCWSGSDVNPVRRIWVAHNLAEDHKKEEDSKWQHTYVFVGSMSSKAAKEIQKQLEKQEEKAKTLRRKVVEESVNQVIRGDEKAQEEIEVELGGQKIKIKKVYTPSSLEELEDEMRKIFAGEADFHDAMVEEQNQKVREAVESRKKAFAEAAKAAREKLDEREASGEHNSLVGYTPEQLKSLNPNILKAKKTDTYSNSSEAHRLYEQFVGPKIIPGVIGIDLKVSAPNADDPRLKNSPEAPAEDLNQKISNRKPSLKNLGG